MKVQDISIDKIKPYWHNPRKNEKTVEKIATSIQKFGFNVPLVVNKDMVIITGHARLKALKKLGYEKVPCVVVNMSDEEAKKYRIADNKIQESTEWDEQALMKELSEIGDAYELLDLGFSNDEINKIIGEVNNAVDDVVDEIDGITISVGPSHVQASTINQNMIEEDDIDEEEFNKKLKEREQELNGRFVRESHEGHKYDNIVVCPHCGEQFVVRGLKNVDK